MIRTERQGLAYYRFATLLAEPGLHHAFFTRLGGVSEPPYDTLNVGADVGDDPQAVEVNRRRCFAALGYDERQVVSPHQVHSATVAAVSAADGGRLIPATDGLVTDTSDLALFLRFADCVPIILYDRRRRAAGLLHGGWRGTLAGIAGQGVAAMQAQLGSRPAELWAGVGPCIGACCYEVGEELAGRFRARFGGRAVEQSAGQAPTLDLAAANAATLQEAGVGEVEIAGLCTACHTGEFFSHRRERGRTGRLAVLIAVATGV